MIPFHSRVPYRQYFKNKPNPVGATLFVRSGRLLMVFDCEFYQGRNTGISAEYKELGLDKFFAMRMVEKLPQNENIKVYFGNFLAGIQLLAQLENKEFCALGVLKTNRMEGTDLMSKREIKKEVEE